MSLVNRYFNETGNWSQLSTSNTYEIDDTEKAISSKVKVTEDISKNASFELTSICYWWFCDFGQNGDKRCD